MPRTRIRTLNALALAALLALGTLASTGCAPTLPSEPPGITGAVTRLAAGDGRPASITVEGQTQPAGALSDKAAITVPPTTMFFDSKGNAASLGAIAHIAIGTKVRVWFNGPVAESYPVQGSAEAVQILGK
jgi:beta-N-acetylhexosaminidase